MPQYDKPVPVPNAASQAFWEGCKRHELLIPRCLRCGAYHFFPRFFCVQCMSPDLEWVKTSGRGEIYSFSIVERAGMPAFAAEAPYVLSLVELEEGVRMMSNIVGCPPGKVRIGMKVEVVFEDVTDEITLPKFQPRAES